MFNLVDVKLAVLPCLVRFLRAFDDGFCRFKNNELTLKTKKKKRKAPKIDLDFSSISQDIKKSVESVILKHWKTHGGPILDDLDVTELLSQKKKAEDTEPDTVGFGAATPVAHRSPDACTSRE